MDFTHFLKLPLHVNLINSKKVQDKKKSLLDYILQLAWWIDFVKLQKILSTVYTIFLFY